MRAAVLLVVLAGLAMLARPACAEVVQSSPGAFVLHAEQKVAAAPDRAWDSLIHPDRWWGSDHSYSGDAHNLSLEPRAGGCWCETWDGNSVAHARVLLVLERNHVRTLRLEAPLGPLQEMAVNAILTFTIAPDPNGAKIEMSYRVSGDASARLDQMAPVVDRVIMEQFGRLIRLAATGSPH